jgi:hypothetical protein
MTCNNGHTTCIGPICTAANVPKRPLIGPAKDKAAIRQGLADICYYFLKETPTSFVTAYSRLESATRYLLLAQDIIGKQSTWTWKVKLYSYKAQYHVAIRLEKVKL